MFKFGFQVTESDHLCPARVRGVSLKAVPFCATFRDFPSFPVIVNVFQREELPPR